MAAQRRAPTTDASPGLDRRRKRATGQREDEAAIPSRGERRLRRYRYRWRWRVLVGVGYGRRRGRGRPWASIARGSPGHGSDLRPRGNRLHQQPAVNGGIHDRPAPACRRRAAPALARRRGATQSRYPSPWLPRDDGPPRRRRPLRRQRPRIPLDEGEKDHQEKQPAR